MNKIILSGRIGNVPELKHDQKGEPFCRISLAVDKGKRNDDKQPDWFPCIFQGKQAEALVQYAVKGQVLHSVEGRGHFSEYTDKQTGETRTGFTVWCYNFEFGERPRNAAPTSESAESPSDLPPTSSGGQGGNSDDPNSEPLPF